MTHAERQRLYRERTQRHVTEMALKILILQDELKASRDELAASRDALKRANEKIQQLSTQAKVESRDISQTLFSIESPSEISFLKTTPSMPPTGGRVNAKGKDAKRGGPISPSWEPTEADREFAAGLRLNADAIRPEFVDYWIAVPGQRGHKVDWSATFRNWCRRIVASGHINGYQLPQVPERSAPRGPAPKVPEWFIAEHPEIRRFYE